MEWKNPITAAFLVCCMVLLAMVSGCTGSTGRRPPKNGDVVKVEYTGTLADGTVFDTSEGRGPSQFTVGAGEMISGFDRAVLGMRVGESKTVTIPADQAYGAYREDLLVDLDREQFGNTSVPEVGQEITISTPYGQTMTVPVINVTDSAVTVDVNHPLAGKDLTFAITLVEIA